MSHTVELGQLVLSHHRANLQLELTASFTASRLEHSIDIQQCQHQDILSFLTSRSVWVSRGNGLHLNVELDVEGYLLSEKEIETTTAILRDAALWSQLNLRVSSPVDPPHAPASEKTTIRLDISYDREDVDTQKQSHRIATGVPSVDNQPPSGICTVGLESIRFLVKVIAARHRRKDKRAKRQPQDEGIEITADVDLFEARYTDSSIFGGSQAQIGLHHEDTLLLDRSTVSTQDEILQDSSTTNCNLKRPASPLGLDRHFAHIGDLDMEGFTSLLDAAFRLVICKKPLKLTSGIKTKKCHLAARLADIAPGLWSPNHLLATSQRSCFLPTISRGLTRTVYSKCRSITLRSKIDSLCQREPCQCDEGHTIHPHALSSLSDANDKAEAIGTELWKLLASTLFDPNAAKRLKPLQQTHDSTPTMADADVYLQEQAATNLEWDFETFIEDDDLLYDDDSALLCLDEEMLKDSPWDASASLNEYQDNAPDIDFSCFGNDQGSHSQTLFPAPILTSIERLEDFSDDVDIEVAPNSDDNLWDCPPASQASISRLMGPQYPPSLSGRLVHLGEIVGPSSTYFDMLMSNL